LVVTLAGQVSTGGWVSLMVMVKEQLPVLPLSSLAEQLTVVTPLGKVEPAGGVQVGVQDALPAGPLGLGSGGLHGQLSVTVGAL
jgi:hypothetical protein